MTTQEITALLNKPRLNVDEFWALKQAGVFAAYSKAELLDGEMFGVLKQPDDEPETDASVPIKLEHVDGYWLPV